MQSKTIRVSRGIWAAFFALQFVVVSQAVAVPMAHLTLESEPGDFIGQGGSFDISYTPDNSSFFSTSIRRTVGPAPGSPAELLFVLGTVTSGPDNTFALLFFGTDQLGIPIQPGVYPDAQRADFAAPGHPGLDVSFQNRGSNMLTGSFEIFEVSFISDPFGALRIATFDAAFEQHSEGAAPALFGRFRYDLGLTSSTPEPSTLLLLGTGLVGLVSYNRRNR